LLKTLRFFFKGPRKGDDDLAVLREKHSTRQRGGEQTLFFRLEFADLVEQIFFGILDSGRCFFGVPCQFLAEIFRQFAHRPIQAVSQNNMDVFS
jgi:hypothetical protein